MSQCNCYPEKISGLHQNLLGICTVHYTAFFFVAVLEEVSLKEQRQFSKNVATLRVEGKVLLENRPEKWLLCSCCFCDCSVILVQLHKLSE